MILPQNGFATGSAYTGTPTIIESSPQYQNYQTAPGLAPSQTAPADQVPALGKPIIIDRREITPQSSTFQSPSNTNTGLQGIRPIRDPNPQLRGNQYVPVTPTDDLTAQAPTRQRWDYSTVRLAGYSQPSGDAPQTYQGQIYVESQPPAADPSVNSAWRNMD
jgi:hypothetical protein